MIYMIEKERDIDIDEVNLLLDIYHVEEVQGCVSLSILLSKKSINSQNKLLHLLNILSIMYTIPNVYPICI